MTSTTGTSRTVISSVAVAVAIFVAVMVFASRSTSFDEAGGSPSNSSAGGMAGMDMPGMDMSGSAPTPTPSMAADMPGMDMSGADHEHATSAAAALPLAPVLGTFGGGTSAVLFAAGFLRRKDRAASRAKKAARLAGNAKK